MIFGHYGGIAGVAAVGGWRGAERGEVLGDGGGLGFQVVAGRRWRVHGEQAMVWVVAEGVGRRPLAD